MSLEVQFENRTSVPLEHIPLPQKKSLNSAPKPILIGNGSVESIQKVSKNCLTALGAGAAGNFLLRRFIYEPLGHADFCPALPEAVHRYASNICKFSSITDIGSVQTAMGITRPIVEELIFRVALQEIALKKLPKWVLGKVTTPEKSEEIVNSTAAKIARVCTTALAFSLAHAMRPCPKMGGTALWLQVTFLLGLEFGAIQEATSNPLYATAAHIGNNLVAAFLAHAMNSALVCPE